MKSLTKALSVAIVVLFLLSVSIWVVATIRLVEVQMISRQQEKRATLLNEQTNEQTALLNEIRAYYAKTAQKAVEVAIASMPGDAVRDMDYDVRLAALKQSYLLEIADPIPGCHRLLEYFVFVEMPRYLESDGYFGPEQSDKIKSFSSTPWSVIVYCYNQLNKVRDFYENARANGATRDTFEKLKVEADIKLP